MSRAAGRAEVVITGGGTAGHVLPALSIGRALVELGYEPASVHFVGSRRGMEAALVPAAGFPVTLLRGRGIARRLTLDNLGAALGLASATASAVGLLVRLRPKVVVTVGGYAGLPAAAVALLARIPVVVVNVDAVPGAANRAVGRFATLSAVALPGTPLPRAVVTGAPVRPEVLAESRSPEGRAAARAELGLPAGAFVVAVTGGSLGARRINDAAPGLLARLQRHPAGAPAPSTGRPAATPPPPAHRPATAPAPSIGGGSGEIVVYHVSGERDHARVAAAASELGLEAGGPNEPARGGAAPPTGAHPYRLVAYETRLPVLLAACDLLVARAGASTVAEVTALGVPSVLVPLPGAPADHQRRNAEVLEGAGAAVLLEDAACTPARLAEVVGALQADPGRLAAMAAAAASLGRPDAAALVAGLVDTLVRRGGRPSQLAGTPASR